jgi:hypothetical protein
MLVCDQVAFQGNGAMSGSTQLVRAWELASVDER